VADARTDRHPEIRVSPTDIAPPTRRPARFPLYTAVSPIHDPATLRGSLAPYAAALAALGAEAWEPRSGPADAPPAVFVATGGTEQLVLEHARFETREPVVLIAHPGHNSLPASLEVLARLEQTGVRGRIHYLRGPDDADGLTALAEGLHDRAVRRELLASRIGCVGAPSDWLVASRPDAATVREVWGPTVVPLALEPLLGEPDADVRARGESLARDFAGAASATLEPATADLDASGRVHALLRRLVAAERLDAITVRCFDLVVRRHQTGCLALAQLNDEGVIAGCEGDLVTTVAMLWLHRLLGALPWMANPSRVDLARGVLTLAHCTVPRGAAVRYRLRSHFESGLGAAVQGELAPGPVTLVRLGGPRMERLWARDGTLERNTDHADLCRTQVEVAVGTSALEELLSHPLGNHTVLVPGHHAARLVRWHSGIVA
jgi:L-fucose isomerase-like protein